MSNASNTSSCPRLEELPFSLFQLEDLGYMLLLPVVCLLGLVLNTLTATTILLAPPALLGYRPQLLSRTLLDMATLLVVLPVGFMRCVSCQWRGSVWRAFKSVYKPYVYVLLGNTSSTASLWITASVFAQRVLVLRRHWPRAQRVSPWVSVAVILLFSFCLSLPHLFTGSGGADNVLEILVDPTATENQFDVYSWVRVSLAIFAPTAVVALTSMCLVRDISRTRRKRLSCVLQGAEDSRIAKRERRLTAMLIGVSLGFLLAHVPESFSNSGVFRSLFGECSVLYGPYRIFRFVGNIVEMVSYSLGFFIYYAWNELFRRHFRGLCACPPDRDAT